MWDLDVRRFGYYASSTSYLVARASESTSGSKRVRDPFPEEELPAGRPE